MKKILKLSEKLFIDLDSGLCSSAFNFQSGVYNERLPLGLLTIVNYLVEHKEMVCLTENLEALFDGNLPSEKSAGIRQQISRLKQRLCAMDPELEPEEVKMLIQSVRGKGYIFHLPKDGEILYVASPADALVQLDAASLAQIRSQASPEEDQVRLSFERMEGSWQNTMKAVALGLDICTIEQKKLLRRLEEFVLEEDCAHGIAVLCSPGAEGKTVLLSELVFRCVEAHPNWNIYYLDLAGVSVTEELIGEMFAFFRANGVGRTRKNLLVMDPPCFDDPGLAMLLKAVAADPLSWLYVIITARQFAFRRAVSEGSFAGSEVAFRVFSMEAADNSQQKARVMIRIVQHQFQVKAGWGKAQAQKILQGLSCGKEDYIDLYLDLLCACDNKLVWGLDEKTHDMELGKYADLVRQERLQKKVREELSCMGLLPWEVWKRDFQTQDALCAKQKLSGIFPYMALLDVHHIPVTFSFLQHLTGYPSVDGLRELLSGRDSLLTIHGDALRFSHPCTSRAFFFVKSCLLVQMLLEELLGSSWLDAGTLLELVRYLFGNFIHKDPLSFPYSLNLARLLDILRQNSGYGKILAGQGMAHVPEIAALWMTFGEEYRDSDLSGMKSAFSGAFYRAVMSASEELHRLFYWKEMLGLAVYYFPEVPKCLMDFFREQSPSTQESLITSLSVSLSGEYGYRGKAWTDRMKQYMRQLTQAGDAIPEPDKTTPGGGYPSMQEASRLEQKIKDAMEKDDFEEMFSLLDRLNKLLHDTYQKAMAEKDRGLLCIVLIKWTGLRRETMNYAESNKLIRIALREIPENQEGFYWIYYELGVLAEEKGVPEAGRGNPYYSLQKAEQAYLKGYMLYQKYGNKNDLEPFVTFLKSLASLYYRQGREEDEMKIYHIIEKQIPASMIRDEIHGNGEALEGNPDD